MTNIMLTVLWLALAGACSAQWPNSAITTAPYQTPVYENRQPTPSPFKHYSTDALRYVVDTDYPSVPTPSASPNDEYKSTQAAFIHPMPHSRHDITQPLPHDFTPVPSATARPAEESAVPMVDVPIPVPPYHTQIAMRDLNQIPAYSRPAQITSPIIIHSYTPLASPHVTPLYYSQRKYGRPTTVSTSPTPPANTVIADVSPIIISPYTPLVSPPGAPTHYTQRKYRLKATATPMPSSTITAVDPPFIVSPYTPLVTPQVSPIYYSGRKYRPLTTATSTPTAHTIAVESPIIISPYTPLATPNISSMYYSQRKYRRVRATTPSPSADIVAVESPIIISPYTPLVTPYASPIYYSERKYGRPTTTTTTPTPSASSGATQTDADIAITSPIVISPNSPFPAPHVTPIYYSQRQHGSSAETTTTTRSSSNKVTTTGTADASASPKAAYTSEFTAIPLPVPSHSGFPAMRTLTKHVIYRPLEMPHRNPLPAHIYALDRTGRLIRAETVAATPSPSSSPTFHFINFGSLRSYAPLPSSGFITFENRRADTAGFPDDQTGVSITTKEPSPSPTFTPSIYQLGRRVFEPQIYASAMPTPVPIASPKPCETVDVQSEITANARFETVVNMTVLAMPSMSPMKTADISWFTNDTKRLAADTHQFIQNAVRHRTVKRYTPTPAPTRSGTSAEIETGTIQTDRSYFVLNPGWSKQTGMTPSAAPSKTPVYDAFPDEVRQGYDVISDRVTPSPSTTPRYKQFNDVYGRTLVMPVPSPGMYPLPHHSQLIHSSSPPPTASMFLYPSGFIGPNEFARIAARNELMDDFQNTPSYDLECDPVKQCLCAVVERELLTHELLQFCSQLDALTVAVCEQTREAHLFFEFWRNKHDERGLDVVKRCFPELQYMLML